MENNEKYAKAFMDILKVSPEQLPTLSYQDVKEWDSIGHLALISALEEAFDIVFEPDDIIDLSSFEVGKEILKKYDIQF